jgi:hypothetical protein
MAAEESPDPLTALREQLERTERAARRLADEATAAAGRDREAPPPAGWRAVETGGGGPAAELTAAWAALVEALGTALPVEVRERLLAVVRELLLALRAVLDLALARMDARRRAPAEVHDIPID